MWLTWQLSVPAIGLTSFDQRQPGAKVPLPTGPVSRLTSSTWPFALNSRTSSGESKPFPSSGMGLLSVGCQPTLTRAGRPLGYFFAGALAPVAGDRVLELAQ